MHLASKGGHSDTVELPISNGANVHAEKGRNKTPLHFASKGGHTDTVELLISKRADVHAEDMYMVQPNTSALCLRERSL